MKKWLGDHPKILTGCLVLIFLAVITALCLFVLNEEPHDLGDFIKTFAFEIVFYGIIIWMGSSK